MVALNPEHAEALAAAGLNRQDIAGRLQELCTQPVADLRRYAPAFAPARAGGGDQTARPCFAGAEDILVIVAGGNGLYSMVMPSWCAGPHRNRAVSVQAETGQFCEVP